MKFRTEITLLPSAFSLSHSDKMMAIGSCFSENISERMQRGGFTVDSNPFGIVYNPLSIADSLQALIQQKRYTEADLFFYENAWHSFAHHSRFSGEDPVAVLAKINASVAHSAAFLRKTQCLVISFGTAHVYRWAATGQIVANCHKRPAREFEEQRLSVGQITEVWNQLIPELQTLNAGLQILFTVSPVRYQKNGAHSNQLSKATLLLAVNELAQFHAGCDYFPAYELLLDDLRDYRFYADDLLHPNTQAVDYIWEKFGDRYFNPITKDAIRKYEKEYKSANHRKIIK